MYEMEICVRALSECDRYKKKCEDDLVPLDGELGGGGDRHTCTAGFTAGNLLPSVWVN
jgi:hypothetical protein